MWTFATKILYTSEFSYKDLFLSKICLRWTMLLSRLLQRIGWKKQWFTSNSLKEFNLHENGICRCTFFSLLEIRTFAYAKPTHPSKSEHCLRLQVHTKIQMLRRVEAESRRLCLKFFSGTMQQGDIIHLVASINLFVTVLLLEKC